jgi:hypothetical protein
LSQGEVLSIRLRHVLPENCHVSSQYVSGLGVHSRRTRCFHHHLALVSGGGHLWRGRRIDRAVIAWLQSNQTLAPAPSSPLNSHRAALSISDEHRRESCCIFTHYSSFNIQHCSIFLDGAFSPLLHFLQIERTRRLTQRRMCPKRKRVGRPRICMCRMSLILC